MTQIPISMVFPQMLYLLTEKPMRCTPHESNYEDELSNMGASEADKLQEFLKYIKFEESCGDPARVQVLYERAVSELPVSSDVWMGYTSYLDRTLKVLLETPMCQYSNDGDNLPPRGDYGEKAPVANRLEKAMPKGDTKITGKNTFTAPRAVVKPLGWTKKDEKSDGGAEELKSNKDFRNILLKK